MSENTEDFKRIYPNLTNVKVGDRLFMRHNYKLLHETFLATVRDVYKNGEVRIGDCVFSPYSNGSNKWGCYYRGSYYGEDYFAFPVILMNKKRINNMLKEQKDFVMGLKKELQKILDNNNKEE
jgi:hypothetical protein